MKKLWFALSLVMAILTGACAAADQPSLTVAQVYEQAQSGWHQSIASVRGETVVVDIDIAVPDVETFPCYYAQDMPAVAGVPTKKNDLAEEGENAFVNEDGFFRFDWPNNTVQRQWRAEAKKNGTAFDSPGEPRALMLRFGQFDKDTAYSVNNPTTMADAAKLMEECVQTYFSGMSIQLMPHQLHAHVEPGRYKKDKNTGDYVKTEDAPDFQGCLFASFDQVIDGIPVLGYGYQGYAGYKGANKKGEALGQLGGICITQGLKDMGSDALYRSLQFKLIATGEQLAKDVPLCSLETVFETAGRLIEAGRLRTVDSMRLGYVVWLDKAHTYRLMPTWVIEGELFERADKGYRTPVTILTDEPSEYANVYIDAQTGELINPWKTGDSRAYDAPELVTWADLK